MSDQGGPWKPAYHKAPSAAGRFAILAWVGLMALAGACIWGLMKLFPGRISTPEDVGDLIWRLTFVAVLTAGFVASRRNLRGAIRHLGGWLAIVAVLALGYSFRAELRFAAERVRAEFAPGYAVATAPHEMVVSQDVSGHFVVIGKVNGRPVPFLVDTGASDIVLSPADAARLGVDTASLEFSAMAETANGVGRSAPFIADSLEVGDMRLSDVKMQINQAPMSISLLGMSFFRRLESFRVEGDRLYLRWRE